MKPDRSKPYLSQTGLNNFINRRITRNVIMSGDANDTTCGQCGQVITDESSSEDPTRRKPCPQCGSTARSFSVQATITLRASVAGQAQVITYPQTLLSVAKELMENGQFSIAVVVAHMACEIATERSLSEAFVTRGFSILKRLLKIFSMDTISQMIRSGSFTQH